MHQPHPQDAMYKDALHKDALHKDFMHKDLAQRLGEDRSTPACAEASHADPIARLLSFHDEIRVQVQSLVDLVRGRGDAIAQQEAAANLATFFEGPFRWHDLDEGTSLFPRLTRVKAQLDLADLIRQLTRSQDVVDQRLATLLPHFHFLAGGGSRDPILLRHATRDLRAHLDRHLAIEEEIIFPLATRCLGQKALLAINEEFEARDREREQGAGGGRRAIFLNASLNAQRRQHDMDSE